jgi:hypothetical protein
VSKINFLTPVRQYNATLAREIIDENATGSLRRPSSDTGTTIIGVDDDITPVFNPYLYSDHYDSRV